MGSKKLIALVGSICLVLALIAVALPACTSSTSAETLKIGTTLPMNSPYGFNTEKAYKIMVRQFNDAGGLVVDGKRYRIEHIVYDDEYTTDKGRSGIERLIFVDGVRHIIGDVASPAVLGSIPVTEAEKVILMADCTTNKFLEPPNHYTFRTGESPVGQPAKFLYVLEAYPNTKTIAFMGPDDEAGHADADNWTLVSQKFGLQVLGAEFYPRGTTDFTAPATKMASLNPDVVQFCSSEGGSDIGLQMKALREAGYKGQPVQTEILNIDAMREVASDEVLEGMTGRIPVDFTPNPTPKVVALKDEWVRVYGEWPRMAFGFLGAFDAFITAVQKADSLDSDDLWEAMQGLEYDAVEGRCLMVKRPDLGVTRFADCAAPINFGRMMGGQFVYEYTASPEEVIEAAETVRGYEGQWR